MLRNLCWKSYFSYSCYTIRSVENQLELYSVKWVKQTSGSRVTQHHLGVCGMECILLRHISVQLAATPLELVCKYFRQQIVLVCAFQAIGQMIISDLMGFFFAYRNRWDKQKVMVLAECEAVETLKKMRNICFQLVMTITISLSFEELLITQV